MSTLVLIKEFKAHEFDCQCGNADCDYGYADMEDSIVSALFTARKVAGVGFTINSAVRCPRHPLALKNPTSSHNADRAKGKKSCAVDIATPTSSHAFEVMDGFRRAGVTRLGWNQKLFFIHADTDASKPARVFFPYN